MPKVRTTLYLVLGDGEQIVLWHIENARIHGFRQAISEYWIVDHVITSDSHAIEMEQAGGTVSRVIDRTSLARVIRVCHPAGQVETAMVLK